MKFSQKLMELRKGKGMSQGELADKLNVTRQTVSKWELDQTVPDMNKLKEISKLFDISLDELVNDIKITNSEGEYKESPIEKNNKKISIILLISGIIIALILCGIGLIKQQDAKKTNNEREQQATQQSQMAINNAKARLEEIEQEIIPLQEQYDAKLQEKNSLNMSDSNWFARSVQLQDEASDIYSKIADLQSEKFQIEKADYTVYYSLVKPITYLIFYYIGAGVFVVITLIALIYFLCTRKK